MVLEVTAKDNKGRTFKEVRSYYPIGVDLDGYMRYGAWQIKELVDLTLQPRTVQKERMILEFDKDVETADVTVNVYYYISGKKGSIIHTKNRHLVFE